MRLVGVGRYERHGAGPPVLILSSPQADPAWWARPYLTALNAVGYEAVTFVHTAESVDPTDVVRDVVALIEHLDIAPVRLLGWSQGAAIAQEVALLRPDAVVAAAMVAGYGRQNSFDRLAQSAWATLRASGTEYDSVRLALLFLTGFPPDMLGDDAFVDARLPGMRETLGELAGKSDSGERSAAFITAYQDRLSALADMKVPCLSIGFELDTDTFVARAREVAAAIPGCRYHEVADAGHLAPITQPDLIAAPVLAFFRDIDRHHGQLPTR